MRVERAKRSLRPPRNHCVLCAKPSLFSDGEFVEGNVLVDADVRRKAEYAFGDDVAQDFVGSAGDAKSRRVHPALLKGAVRWRIVALERACFAFQRRRKGA